MRLNQALTEILAPAYLPCIEFERACKGEMCWCPQKGFAPRGFLGASGLLEEVELILVFAQPGNPFDNEQPFDIESACNYTEKAFREGVNLFHRNVRYILKTCWPNLTFVEQMRKVWLTESVLCSAREECGNVSSLVSKTCGRHYLLAQLSLFPNAFVVALGGKAKRRLHALEFDNFLPAFSVAPPGCNAPEAKESWKRIPPELKKRQAKK